MPEQNRARSISGDGPSTLTADAPPTTTMSVDSVSEMTRRLTDQRIDLSVDPVRRLAASRDYSWLSPVLTAKLPDRTADVVARPRSTDELACCVSQAAQHLVPLTIRGKGTGNYGQSVPLSGGLVIDTLGLNQIFEIGEDYARVAPGVSCRALERVARRDGQELVMFPSTTTSTIGGFVAGGAGGSGSIANGFVWDGFVKAVSVLPVIEDCSPLSLGQATGALGTEPTLELSDILHTYGTVGVISELTVGLETARDWTGLIVSFSTMAEAAESARSMLKSGVDFRLLGITEAALVASFPRSPWLDITRASLRAVVASEHLDTARIIGLNDGGRVDATGDELVGTITLLSFNHVTLWAKRADPTICHLQVGGADLAKHADLIWHCLPEARYHIDVLGGPQGPHFGGLLMSHFESEELLRAATLELTEAGIHVVDPHSWAVADPEGRHATAAEGTDPLRLLNPGKLARPPSSRYAAEQGLGTN